MKVYFHKNFAKKYSKLQSAEKKRFKERRDIFVRDLYDPILNNHALTGKYKGYRSINIKGDLRAVYRLLRKDSVLFITIDSHSSLYE